MSSVYAHRKLAEALAAAGGSAHAARRIVLEQAADDDRLLRELVTPFLTRIVGHAVERAILAAPKPKSALPAQQLAGQALDGLIRTLGENFAHSTGPLGLRPAPSPRSAASPRHAETIRGLAKAHVHRRAAD